MRNLEINGYIDVQEAAKQMKCTEFWIRKLCERGQITGAMDISEGSYHNWRIPKDFLSKYREKVMKNAKAKRAKARKKKPTATAK